MATIPSKSNEYDILNRFPLGYRNREDITNLQAGTLVVGSQNVLTNVSERIQLRKGYSLDGEDNSSGVPILSSFDWNTKFNSERNIRAGFLTANTQEVTVTIDTPGVFTAVGHGLIEGDGITFTTTGALPTGLTAGTLYYVIATGLTLDDFEVSTSVGGAAVDTSGSQSGVHTLTRQDGRLQFRYDDGSTVTWVDLKKYLNNVKFNFATLWDETELLRLTLFCNGDGNIYEWNGAEATFASATADTITKEGTTFWSENGFYTTRDKKVVIGGIVYTYTGGEGSTTLTGVTPDPTAGGHAVGALAHQEVVTTAIAAITSLPATFKPNLISSMLNQVYYGSTTNQNIYISKFGNYKDVSFTAGGRLPTEGGIARLDSITVGFIPQEEEMYVTAGTDDWYKITFSLSTDQTKEKIEVKRLKTTARQAAISQGAISKMKNDVIMLTNEPTLDTLGRLENILGTPQTKNISDPIKLDFDAYDFTDATIFYYRFFIYVAIPREGIVRMFNLITNSWEAPQVIPVSRFAIIGGDLYGHGYLTSETYKLFDGYNDNGAQIETRARFSYQNYGTRTALKAASQIYIEGYINANTDLAVSIIFDIDGCSQTKSFSINGNDKIVCLGTNSNSLGKYSFGKVPIGSDINTSLTGLPPKFRVIKTFPMTYFYEAQISLETIGVDEQFELIAVGLNAKEAPDMNVAIKD